MRITGIILLTAAVLLSVVPASAADYKPLFYGGVGFGKSIESNAPGGSVGFQGGLMYQFHPQLAVAGEVSYQLLGKDTFLGEDIKYSVIPVTGQLYWLVPSESQIQPMLTAGLGIYNWRVKADVLGVSVSDSETKAGFNFGVGAMFGAKDSAVRFGLDGKYHIISTSGSSTSMVQIMGRVYFGG